MGLTWDNCNLVNISYLSLRIRSFMLLHRQNVGLSCWFSRLHVHSRLGVWCNTVPSLITSGNIRNCYSLSLMDLRDWGPMHMDLLLRSRLGTYRRTSWQATPPLLALCRPCSCDLWVNCIAHAAISGRVSPLGLFSTDVFARYRSASFVLFVSGIVVTWLDFRID